MASLPADTLAPRPHVPARAVLLSAAALWLTYFLLITLRGIVVDLGEFHELLWRRGVVTLAGIAVTLLSWPVLRRFDGRSNGARIGAALVIMLPAALALAAINQQCFAPVEKKLIEREAKAAQAQAEAAARAVSSGQSDVPARAPTDMPLPALRVRHDVSGNVLIDVADPPRAMPAPPAPPAPPVVPRSSGEAGSADDGEQASPVVSTDDAGTANAPGGVSISRRHAIGPRLAADAGQPSPSSPAPSATPSASDSDTQIHSAIISRMIEDEGLWKQLTDVALGRYFLLIAWAGLYIALGNAEMARASERREGEYKRAAKAAELRSLRYQVNPHFLFNTLNSLSALVMAQRTEQAEKMIQTISSFYRHSLAGDPTADVPLADEIALQRHYLEIEAVRFPERLVCEFDVPEALENACVPGMILQPLVENSIKYGVSASTCPVTIRIAAQEAGGRLVLTVADDGPGKTSGNGGTGIGLENVRNRLAARFGDEARVDSGALPAGGYATVLTIPLVRSGCE